MRIAGRLKAAASAVALVALPTAAPAQPPAGAAPPPGAGTWNVDWGERECILLRRSERAPYPTFALSTVPGTRRWQIRLVGGWPRGVPSARRLGVSFQPGGAPVEGRAEIESTESGRGLVLYQLPASVTDLVASAQSVTVSQDGRPTIEIALPRAPEAVAALRECVNNVLRDWGIDPVAFAAVRTPPEGNPAAVVGDGDYPTGAISRHQQGTVTVRLRLDETGRVIGCRPVVSSGSESLDLRTCDIFTRRLRMTPALGADGRPVPTMMVTQLRWVLPD